MAQESLRARSSVTPGRGAAQQERESKNFEGAGEATGSSPADEEREVMDVNDELQTEKANRSSATLDEPAVVNGTATVNDADFHRSRSRPQSCSGCLSERCVRSADCLDCSRRNCPHPLCKSVERRKHCRTLSDTPVAMDETEALDELRRFAKQLAEGSSVAPLSGRWTSSPGHPRT